MKENELPPIRNTSKDEETAAPTAASKLRQLFGKHRGAILNRAVPNKEPKSRKMFEVTMAALRAARDDKLKIPSQDDISKFQVEHKVRKGSWLFLEVQLKCQSEGQGLLFCKD